MPQSLRRFFLQLCLGLIVTLPFTPRAQASWVSHWLGMDHHTSAPTSSPASIKTETTPPPIAIVVIQTPISSVQTINPKVTELPVTGPSNSVLLIIITCTISVIAVSYSLWRKDLRNRIHAIDIL